MATLTESSALMSRDRLARLLVWLLLFPGAGAAATEFEARCQQLAESAGAVNVVFEDIPVTWDTRRDPDELRRLSGGEPNPWHTVLGLTRARPTARVSSSYQSLSDPSGRTCIVGRVTVTLTFSELRVYLASSLVDPCRRRVVEEHELEHVRIWRNHLRAGGRLAEALLRKQLAAPLYVDSPAEASAALSQHVQNAVTPLLAQIATVADAAQRELDTPISYRIGADRMRACG